MKHTDNRERNELDGHARIISAVHTLQTLFLTILKEEFQPHKRPLYHRTGSYIGKEVIRVWLIVPHGIRQIRRRLKAEGYTDTEVSFTSELDVRINVYLRRRQITDTRVSPKEVK